MVGIHERFLKYSKLLVVIILILFIVCYFVYYNMIVSNQIYGKAHHLISNDLDISEVLFTFELKWGYHKIVFVFNDTSWNFTIYNINFASSIVVNTTPQLPFKIDRKHNNLTVIIHNEDYDPMKINNYTCIHRYLYYLNDKFDYIRRTLNADTVTIIYKDPTGNLHKKSFSLYKYFMEFIRKYYYTEYDFDIDHWDTGVYDPFGSKWFSCTYLYLKSYSDKPIHIYLIKLYLYDKHHKLLRIIDYKENLTLKPNSMIEVKLCFQVHVKGIFNVERYGRVYVYSREGVVRSFEQFV